ncbi:phage tail tape measure protein [Paracoccus hibiscisoli]|uniref:Phage tail tape measure protein n=1 Tax=Paracoccus hibiscisoli TaxID=2023261 RepID=A0A4U0QWG4_9RHOB|nr:phage tail tape measure protein [Paracoccus hibiscisoli]TJZ86160.1 phage tail tape measure protein [Paracoccus hibiscisoli]
MAVSGLVGRLRVALGLDDAQFKKGLDDNASRMRQFGKRLAMVGAGLSAAGAGIGLAIRGQLNAADDLSKAAQKIGIPTDELSRLAHAADMSGVSMGSLQGAVGRMSRAMTNSPKKFTDLGIAVRGANGQMRPTSAVMADLAQKLSEMPDGAEKTALAMDLMGRSGAELIPMLNGGRDALQGMLDEADDLGIVITPEMGRAAEQFNDNISRLTKQLGGMWTMIAANLAPVLVTMSDKMVEIATRFRGMSPAMQRFISIAAAAVIVLGPLLSGLGLMIMGAAPFVAAMGSMVLAIKGITLAMAANPIGLAVAAIAGAAVLIYRNWDQVGPWFARMWDSVKAVFAGFRDFVAGIFTGDLSRALDGLKAIFSGLKDYYQGLWDGIVGVFRFAWENGIKPITDALGMTDAILRGWDRLKAGFDRILSGIGAAFDAAWTIIKPVVDALAWVRDNAASAMDALPNQPSDGNNRAGNGRIDFAPTGRDVAAGLSSGTSAIGDQGDTDADSYLARFRKRFGIQSPSRVMIEYGQYMSQGLGMGIANGQPMVDAASAGLGQSMADRITPYFEGVTRDARNLSDVFDNVKTGFARMLQDMASRLAASGLSRIIGGVFDSLFGGDALTGALRGAGLNAIPAMADGGRVLREGLVQVNERGGEIRKLATGDVVIPHELSKMAMRAQVGAEGNVHVTVSVDETGNLQAFVDRRAQGITAQGIQRYDQGMTQRVAAAIRNPRG